MFFGKSFTTGKYLSILCVIPGVKRYVERTLAYSRKRTGR